MTDGTTYVEALVEGEIPDHVGQDEAQQRLNDALPDWAEAYCVRTRQHGVAE